MVRCSVCNARKSVDEFLEDEKEPSGLRPQCKDCDPRTRHKKKKKVYPSEEFIQDDQRIPETTPIGYSGTAICAACGERKSVTEYDKEKSKPLAIRCRDCVRNGTPLRSKMCSSCQRELTLDHFYRDSYTKAGFRPRCTECMRPRKGTPGRRVSTRGQPRKSSSPVLKDEASTSVQQDSTPVIPTQKRTRRKKKPTNADMIMDETTSPKGEANEEGVTSSRRIRSRQRSKTAQAEDPSKDSTTQQPVKSTSQKQNKKTAITEDLVPVVRTRKRSKQFSGATVKDEYGNLAKYCTGCRCLKRTEEFGRDCSKASGLRSRCRSCQRRRNRTFDETSTFLLEDEISESPITVRKTPRKPNRKRKTGQKICAKCDLEKPLSEFYRDRSQSDGISASCKKCLNSVKKKPRDKTSQGLKAARPKQSFGPRVEEENINHVLDYVDALLPESSEESAGLGEFPEDDEIESNSTPTCVSHRICVGCKVDKSWIEFGLNPMLPGGLCPLCKDCLRGNGMSGRRAVKQRPKRRKCVRCKRPRSSIHFAQSLFFPNRITLVCDDCRAKESHRNDNKRNHDGLAKALDIMDYETGALRLSDPGGGERLWRDLKSESELEERRKKKRKTKHNNSKKDTFPNTELHLEANGVTLTHHIPVENWMTSVNLSNTENCVLKDGKKKRRKPMILEKQCKLCGEIKPTDGFAPDSSKTCRLSPHCLKCSNLRF